MEVALEILEPANDANFTGTASVRLRGRQVSTGHPPLFFKWYSSQVAPPSGSNDASIRVPAGGTNFDMTVALPIGTQIITFTTKDQPGESVNEMRNVSNAGMAGGPAPAAKSPCMIHVVLANLLAPASGATVSKAAATLELRAPPQWTDAAFQAINQVTFRFRFIPTGAPAGRPTVNFTPQLEFKNPDPDPPRLRFIGSLPAGLATGNYQLTLLAEKTGDNPAVHQVSRAVNVVP